MARKGGKRGAFARWSDDAMASLPIGGSFQVRPLGSDAAGPFRVDVATRLPQDVGNWDAFDGSIMMVVTGTGDQRDVVGSAVMVAPGLAVTAGHILPPNDDLPTVGLFCAGIRLGDRLELWSVVRVWRTSSGEIAYLSLWPSSAVPPGWHITTVPLTTRRPKLGEMLTIAGFRTERVAWPMMDGDLLVSHGGVLSIRYPWLASTARPYPAIEIDCAARHGTSGGAVLDAGGHLVGVISSGFRIVDDEPPMFAAWIIDGLDATLEIPWPGGIYGDRVRLLDIDPKLLAIRGRHLVRDDPDGRGVRFTMWSDDRELLPGG